MSIFRREPALVISTIIAVVTALITALIAFGVVVTPEQQSAVIGVIQTVLTLGATIVTGAAIRTQVTPSSQVVEQLDGQGGVIAGQASEIETGARIRDAGSIDRVIVAPTPVAGADGSGLV